MKSTVSSKPCGLEHMNIQTNKEKKEILISELRKHGAWLTGATLKALIL